MKAQVRGEAVSEISGIDSSIATVTGVGQRRDGRWDGKRWDGDVE